MGNRNLTFDIAKALSIVLIVAWHLFGQLLSGWWFTFTAWLVNAGMALFFYSSAKFLSHYKIIVLEDVGAFYLRRFKRFYPLYIIAAIGLFLVGFNPDIRVLLTTCLGISTIIPPQPQTLWFMSMMMLFYLITPLILYFHKKVVKLIIFLVLFLLMFFLFQFIIPIDDRFFLYFPFYGAGLILDDSTFIKIKLKKSYLWSVLIIVLFILIVIIHQQFKFSLAINAILQYGGNLFGIILILLMSKYLSNTIRPIIKLLSYISYSTLTVYLFHRIIFLIMLSEFYLTKTDTISILYSTLVVLPITFVASYYLQKAYDVIIKKYVEFTV